MAGRFYVVDEWLFADLKGENQRESQSEAARFMARLKVECDRLAVVRNSEWTRKALPLMNFKDPTRRRLSKFLRLALLDDGNKCRFLESDELKSPPDQIREIVPPSDLYLVETFYTVDATCIITTDVKLHEILSPRQQIEIRLRDDFLEEYLAEEWS